MSRLGRRAKERRAPSRFGEYAAEVVAALDCAQRTTEKHEYQLRVHLEVFKNTRLSEIDVDRVAALVSRPCFLQADFGLTAEVRDPRVGIPPRENP